MALTDEQEAELNRRLHEIEERLGHIDQLLNVLVRVKTDQVGKRPVKHRTAKQAT